MRSSDSKLIRKSTSQVRLRVYVYVHVYFTCAYLCVTVYAHVYVYMLHIACALQNDNQWQCENKTRLSISKKNNLIAVAPGSSNVYPRL